MGKLILLKPQTAPEILAHEGEVKLEDLYRLVECETVDVVQAGTLPTGIQVNLWCDDNGLLNDAKPNRYVGGHLLCGNLLLCGCDPASGDSIAFNDFERALVLAQARTWMMAPEGAEKPKPSFTFVEGV